MKKILLLLSSILLFTFGCTENKNNALDDQPILLDLFYGMEFDAENGVYVDSVLDNIPGLKHFEFDKIWFYNGGDDYNVSWHAQLGMYIDSIIPQNIWQNLQPIVDKNFVEHISYNAPFDCIYANEIGEVVQTPIDYAKKWGNLMEKFSETMKPALDDSVYHRISPLRVCGVIHKVYENHDWATYLVEFSFDYHGSNGCPSYADYISFNKKDGHRLTEDELLQLYDKSKLSEALAKEFNKAKEENDMAPTGDNTLMNMMSGFALIDKGVLIYFQPYVAGSGAEGQYNIIINEADLK